MVPTRRLWLTLSLLALPTLAAGFVPGAQGLVLSLDAALLALAVLDWGLARRVGLSVRRTLPARLQSGVAARVRLALRRPGGAWTVTLELADDAPPGFAATPARLTLRLGRDAGAEASYQVTPAARGRFEFGDVEVRVQGPLGLAWHQRTLPAATRAGVYPDLRGARRLLLSDAALDSVNLGLRAIRQDGQGSELARLRDYAQGDPQRDVDWKATARRGRPVTRVREAERHQTVLVAVDCGRGMAARLGGLSRLDLCVNAALFLAFTALKNRDRVGLVAFAGGVQAYLPPASGRSQYQRLLDVLYAARPEPTHADYLSLLEVLSARLSRRSLLCLFTDLQDEDQAAALALPLRRLARRHVPLVLTVQDTAAAALLLEPPAQAGQAYQQAVASELRLERTAFTRRLLASGLPLLEVAPSALAITAVNRYLEVKRRGVL